MPQKKTTRPSSCACSKRSGMSGPLETGKKLALGCPRVKATVWDYRATHRSALSDESVHQLSIFISQVRM